MKERIELEYTGDYYYFESGTELSPIYRRTPEGYKRYDWGFVKIDLANGNEIVIFQASADLLRWCNKQLAEHKARRQQ